MLCYVMFTTRAGLRASSALYSLQPAAVGFTGTRPRSFLGCESHQRQRSRDCRRRLSSKSHPMKLTSAHYPSGYPTGFTTFASLPYHPILNTPAEQTSTLPPYDIAILGAPFDLGTTYRPGARFGASGIRRGSQHISYLEHCTPYFRANPFMSGATVVDVGDADLTFLDKDMALKQLERAHRTLSSHTASLGPNTRTITLGGDHTTTISALRSLAPIHGPLTLVHFDSHIDTWSPAVLGSESDATGVNHGTVFHIAHAENLLTSSSVHVGIRAPVTSAEDWANDARCGFEIVTARDLDILGIQGIVKRIKARVGGGKVFVSIDVDVLDPAFAPGTGTPEVGGWSTRELLSVVDALAEGNAEDAIEVVGADVVEVAPCYDSPGEITVLAAADVVVSLVRLMVARPEKTKNGGRGKSPSQ